MAVYVLLNGGYRFQQVVCAAPESVSLEHLVSVIFENSHVSRGFVDKQ